MDMQKVSLLAAIIVLLVVLSALVITMPQQRHVGGENKTSTVPTEIKSQAEASSLENDTSSILKEVGDGLADLDKQIPDV